jgi:dTDP-4-dehydrorhamnose 3,5-epimerase
MRFVPTRIHGVYEIELEPHSDERGSFARAFCFQELSEAGLEGRCVQANLSTNHRAGTLRGMHYQLPPATETKLIRCIRGALYDVIVDLRPGSPTYLEHHGVELSADNRRALYVPGMFAHGFQTLEDDTEAFYQVSEFYTPGAERGLRYDDPALAIDWPLPVTVISDKDASWPMLEERAPEGVR